MLDTELNDVEARTNAAQAGPWSVLRDWVDENGHETFRVLAGEYTVCDWASAEDAAFIAAARQDLPAVISELRTATAKLKACSALVAKWQSAQFSGYPGLRAEGNAEEYATELENVLKGLPPWPLIETGGVCAGP